MVLAAKENQITWFPEFHDRWLPPRVWKHIRVVRTTSKVGLEVGGVVGVVPLLNGDTLQIIPKVGNINFLKMLMVCEGLYKEMSQAFDDLATYAKSEESSVSWFVARSLAKCLNEINKKSLRFDHRFSLQKGNFASGRIFPVETTRRLMQLSDNPIVFGAHERSYNTSENRVLGKASQVAIPFLMDEGNSLLRFAAESWSRRFANDFSARDLFEVDRWLASRKLGGL